MEVSDGPMEDDGGQNQRRNVVRRRDNKEEDNGLGGFPTRFLRLERINVAISCASAWLVAGHGGRTTHLPCGGLSRRRQERHMVGVEVGMGGFELVSFAFSVP
jgi:hypothetical protein